ncbi:MAG: hypothetical protein ACI9FJ_001653, partial [Alteromonadaceae bacterium]
KGQLIYRQGDFVANLDGQLAKVVN